MSSINPFYTFTYSQPDEYRFSHDSVFLARRVFEFVKGHSFKHALDLCSGCGIIGLDFLFHSRNDNLVEKFDFLEVQEVYRSHFDLNLKSLQSKVPCQFLNITYDRLLNPDFSEKYDLILCNPPYFREGQGTLSPSEFKNRCRFFLDSNFENLLKGIVNSLTPGGKAFVLLRNLSAHDFDVFSEAQTLLDGKASMTTLEDIRGTDLVLIEKVAASPSR